jgi:hypothetical protein
MPRTLSNTPLIDYSIATAPGWRCVGHRTVEVRREPSVSSARPTRAKAQSCRAPLCPGFDANSPVIIVYQMRRLKATPISIEVRRQRSK